MSPQAIPGVEAVVARLGVRRRSPEQGFRRYVDDIRATGGLLV